MTNDIFDNKILCRKCNAQMKKAQIAKNGFLFRAMICPKCNEKIIHPADEQEYNRFVNLKNKEFRVKMRMVGNSYTVSIPKEIVSFMGEQKTILDEMVKLCFEDFGKLSLNFENEDKNSRIVKAKEIRVVKNGQPVFHSKQFYDSANPKNNKSVVIKKIKEE